jgi:hypothetical protein
MTDETFKGDKDYCSHGVLLETDCPECTKPDKITPRFRVTKEKPHRVFLQCTACDKDIKEIKQHESINITRAYYCADCDPGVIYLNPPRSKS